MGPAPIGIIVLHKINLMDEVIYLTESNGSDGVRDYPVTVRGIKDVQDKVWGLQELSKGSWQAATVARANLPDGTPLALRVYTEDGGMVLRFELAVGGDYYY